jgi:glycosyltransferase involved in cell wall biosynthesis
MAMGKALVASDVGGHKELIQHGETGMLFKAGDVMDLVNVIDKLLIENNLHQHICQKAPAWVAQHHPWAKTTAVYKEIYNGLRQRRKGRKRF